MLHAAALTPAPGQTPAEIEAEAARLLERLATDWLWRLTESGIYQIKVKDPAGEPDSGTAQPFRPNAAQHRLLGALHNRNLILKARQMGFSTLIVLMGVDHALFNADQNVVIQAHDLPSAEEMFRDKVRFAYDRLPDALREAFPLRKATESQLVFDHNGSSIRVVSSARSGTAGFLHVSEMGKLAARFPEKARETTTGSLQALPENGLGFIESTAEGVGGAFYEMAQRAEAKHRARTRLTPLDWRFHFFGWWVDPAYCLSDDLAARVPISPKEHEYFDKVEGETGTTLSLGQRAWYVRKRDEEFAHEPSLMWREYPSTSAECWQTGTEGKYLAAQLARARAEERIGRFPARTDRPTSGYWDLGASDTQVVWLSQADGAFTRWIGHRAGNGEGLLPFVLWIDSLNLPVGTMWLPHDASHVVNGIERPTSLLAQARALRPSWTWRVVPRVSHLQHGIDLMRAAFETYRFDEAACKDGLDHLAAYKRRWITGVAAWADDPEHDEASHHADALRQHAQAMEAPATPGARRRLVHRTTGMTA